MSTKNLNLEILTKNWLALKDSVNGVDGIRNDDEYDLAIADLNTLLDLVGSNENHPLAGLVDLLGSKIEKYDDIHFEPDDASPVEVLKFLMEENNLKQIDLRGIGTQGVVSEILGGKRELNINQIKFLAKRFKVSPMVFIAEDNESSGDFPRTPESTRNRTM